MNHIAHDISPFIQPPPFSDKDKKEGPIPVQEFLPEWLDEGGLPIHVGQWIEENLQPGEKRRGIRWRDHGSDTFFLQRQPPRYKDHKDPRFFAKFELAQGGSMRVRPGEITVHLGVAKVSPVLFVYRQFLVDTDEVSSRLEWQAAVETRVVRPPTEGCPAIMGHTLAKIDQMFYRLTGVNRRRPSTVYSMLGAGGTYQDFHSEKPTVKALLDVYDFVSMYERDSIKSKYHPLPFMNLQDEELYNALLDHTRKMLLNQLPRELQLAEDYH